MVHCTAEIVGHVVVEHLLSAFAGAVDAVATARPATKSNAAFMAIFSPNSGTEDAIPERHARGDHTLD